MLEHAETQRESLKDRLVQLVLSLRGVLWAVLIIIVVGLVTYFIISEVGKNRREQTAILAESAQELFLSWRSEVDDEAKKNLESELLEDIDSIIDRYPRSYGAQRALVLRGDLYFEKELWPKALGDYTRVSDGYPKSYLAPEALLKAAICHEELLDQDKALGFYDRIIQEHPKSPRVPQALFASGRIKETQGKLDEALELYNLMKLDQTQSPWTNLAINRIIYLTSEGKIQN